MKVINFGLYFCTMYALTIFILYSIMYICPYMGKQKYPLQNCLTILHDSMEHNKEHPSCLEAERDLPSRTTKQLLQRVLNQLNLKMESSEYQVVAALLEFPTIVCSDEFAYGNPFADRYYRKIMEGERNVRGQGPAMNLQEFLRRLNPPNAQQPNAIPPPVVNNASGNTSNELCFDSTEVRKLGHMRIFNLKETTPSEETVNRKVMVPFGALYAQRGGQLGSLSRMEMRALISIRKKCEDPSKSKVKEYDFADGFEIGCQYTQYPSAKHKTVILTERAPPHPGLEPIHTATIEHQQWVEKADRYASYFLTEYRPEPGDPLSYGYTWNDLIAYVTTLENDPAILSKFRLMAMHTRMRGFFTQYRVKIMLSDYRGRNRHMWNATDRQKYYTEEWFQKQEERYDRSQIDEELYSQTFNRLSAKSRASVEHMNRFDLAQQKAYQATQPNPAHVFVPPRVRRTGLQSMDPTLVSTAHKLRSFTADVHSDSLAEKKLIPQFVLSASLNDIENSLKSQQKEFFQLYRRFLENPNDRSCFPPDFCLVHGCAGTGKTKLIRAIMKASELTNQESIRTAFNNINALDLAGVTVASLTNLKMPIHMHGYTNLTQERLEELYKKHKDSTFVIIDEISNLAPFHLAQLSWVCQQATGDYDRPFGGKPVIAAGDLNQNLPIKAGHGLTDSLVHQLEHEFEWRPQKKRQRRRRNVLAAPVADSEGTIIHDDDMFSITHPHGKGLELLKDARWFELTEQMRSEDPVHTELVVRLYHQGPIELEDLQQYKILSSSDFEGNNPWHDAPYIVATNRERYSIIHLAAIRYARAHGTVAVRWPVHYTRWQQKPPPEFIAEALEDPCFYDYFVVGSKGNLSDTINKDLGLVNALPFTYHSFTVSDEDRATVDLQLQQAKPGDVVTLPHPPKTVNLLFDPEECASTLTTDRCNHLRTFSMVPNSIVLPISEGSRKVKDKVPIPGGIGYLPSRVSIHSCFPFEPRFCLTVNKAEGQTLLREILCLSNRRVKQMDRRSIYVALSRVKCRENIRLLLTGDSVDEKYISMAYIPQLPTIKSTDIYFSGFTRPTVNANWISNEWNSQKAFHHYRSITES